MSPVQGQPDLDKSGESGDQPTIVGSPTKELSEEERAQRAMGEAQRLASLAPGEWNLWYKRRAERLGIDPKSFSELIQAQIKDREQKERKAQAEARLQEDRAKRLRLAERDRQREQQRIEDAAKTRAKEKAKAFADIIKLSSDQHEAKLEELAKRLSEDAAALKGEFAEYCAAETPSSGATSEWDNVEPWPEAIPTAQLLEELIACIKKHVRSKTRDGELVVALWNMMAWAHEEAAHYSVYLVATSPKDDCGKTTLLVEVLGRLVPKPWISASKPTVSNIFRTADRVKPSMIVDNVDTLFQRNHEVTELFLNGWTRGIKYSRNERVGGEWVSVSYDPFCPKACTLIGSDLPRPLLGRCLLIELWPLKLGDEVVEVDPFDQELMETFKVLRRKLARWNQDNVAALKTAKPIFPVGLTTRPRANAKLLLAIAELTGDAYAERARIALNKLLREEKEPSWLELLLRELWMVFVEEQRKDITSKQLVTRLTADPTSEWCDYGRGHRVTEREVAALLRKLHIRPHPIGRQRVRGYHRQDFLDNEVFEHFLQRDPLIRSPDTRPKKSIQSRSKKVNRSRRHKKASR
jgi:hypothetical protein